MPLDVPQMILAEIALSEDGVCTHDLFTNIGGEDVIPRKNLFKLLKTMVHNKMLVKGSGTDSRGRLAFKWSTNAKL